MANRMAESTSDIQTAARHAMKLLGKGETRPALEQAQEVLRLYPDEINCQFVVAAAQRALGEKELALKNLKVIVDRVPEFAVAQQELGFAHADAGNTDLAIDALKTAVKRESRLAGSWKLLGELLLARGEEEAAADAFNQSALVSADNPRLGEAIKLFRAGRLGQAEQLCREILMDQPTDVNTIRLLAEIGVKVGVYDDAQKLLERCLELAPDFDLARLNYANVLSQRNKLAEALAQANLMLEREPDKQALLGLKAQVLQKMSEFEQALPIYNRLLTEFTPQPGIALAYGHALKTIGDQETAIAAYRQAAELRPGFGDAWWSLANLKTFRFEDDDIAAMRREMRWEKPWNCERNSRIPSSSMIWATGPRSGWRATVPMKTTMRYSALSTPALAMWSLRHPVAAARHPTPYSSSACRAPDRPCWSRSWPVTPR
jgi:tetratricopeptide (TPR) repeat protein